MPRSFRLLTSALFLILAAPGPTSAQRAAFDEARRVQTRAMTAYEAGDMTSFVELTREALDLRPKHPTLLYNLASGFARIARPDSALAYLQRLHDLGLSYDVRGDPDFEPLGHSPAFIAVAEQLESNGYPTANSDTAFVLPASAQIPEAVALDPSTGIVYVSSVYDRAVYRKRGDLIDKLIDLDATSFEDCPCHGRTGPESSGNVAPHPAATFIGLALDADRKVLWASRSEVPAVAETVQTEHRPSAAPASAGASAAIVRIGTESGTILGEYAVDGSENAFLGDVAVAADGTVYVSETRAGAMYRLRPDQDRLRTLVPPGTLVSPQGIAIPPKSPFLFVADYALGIVQVDSASGEVRVLRTADDLMLLGIDGLLWHEGRLIAIQNGSRPQRVLELTLDEAEASIVRATVLESNHAAYPEPTTGTIYADTLYYVGNSNWNLLEAPAEERRQTSEPRLILRLPLPAAAQ